MKFQSKRSHEWVQHSPAHIECAACHYSVKVDPDETARNSWTHWPEEKTILVGKQSITILDAEKAMKIWGIDCGGSR